MVVSLFGQHCVCDEIVALSTGEFDSEAADLEIEHPVVHLPLGRKVVRSIGFGHVSLIESAALAVAREVLAPGENLPATVVTSNVGAAGEIAIFISLRKRPRPHILRVRYFYIVCLSSGAFFRVGFVS